MAEKGANYMYKPKVMRSKPHSKYHQKLFKRYLLTAQYLSWQMKKKNPFPQKMITDFRNFLNNISQLKKFPDGCKTLEEFLFEDPARYALCDCYKLFTLLSKLEISYAEDVAQYDT